MHNNTFKIRSSGKVDKRRVLVVVVVVVVVLAVALVVVDPFVKNFLVA